MKQGRKYYKANSINIIEQVLKTLLSIINQVIKQIIEAL